MILDRIIADKREEIRASKIHTPLAIARARAESVAPAREFEIAKTQNVALIAEVKRASPSRGEITSRVKPDDVARTYEKNGAAAISVLTDTKYFNGSSLDLTQARTAVSLPVLRKDFVIDEYQVYETRALEADAVLLIVRILTDSQLRDYIAVAFALGMQPLVEIHDEAELERALIAGADIVGINNRNLAGFGVDLAVTERLAPRVPSGKKIVAESGVFTVADVERCARAGADAVLVGEALMRAKNRAALVSELASVRRRQKSSQFSEPTVFGGT